MSPAPMSSRPLKAAAGTLTAGAAALGLAACVTNVEPALPPGWEEITPPAQADIQALVPEGVDHITVGTNPPFPPFQFKEPGGQIVGFEMDLARAVAATMGLDFSIREQEFSLILPAVDAGTIEFGASGFTDTPERQENYDFVDFIYAGLQWSKPVDGDDVDPEHPCGLTVAVQRTTVAETDEARPKDEACQAAGEDPVEVLAYDTNDAAATAAIVGRADAFIADAPVLAWAMERSEGRLEPVGEQLDAAPYGFALAKDSELTDAVLAAMDYLIESGYYEEILAQWNIEDGLLTEPMRNAKPAASAG